MTTRISKTDLIEDFQKIGIRPGDVVLIRASLGAVGKISGGAEAFIDALSDVVGAEGTIVSLAFTDSAFIKKPKIEDAFDLKKKSYAGALPNSMVSRSDALRSRHPTCSYVAIGKHARYIIEDHDERSLAYEPVRKIVELNGKNVLVGCVGSSPGFTTTHLAESDLGHLKTLPVFPWLKKTYYYDKNGDLKLFTRQDPGLCSNSFYKFYSLYVKNGILNTGYIGGAYSIIAPAKECFEIELQTLSNDKEFNICDTKACWTCNAGRWDRIHHAPMFIIRKIFEKFQGKKSQT